MSTPIEPWRVLVWLARFSARLDRLWRAQLERQAARAEKLAEAKLALTRSPGFARFLRASLRARGFSDADVDRTVAHFVQPRSARRRYQ